MRVLVLVCTRPEAIKLAPLIGEARGRGLAVVVCATAQHRGMLDQVLDLFAIQPDHDLDLMRPDQSLPDLTARAIQAIDGVVSAERPNWILVQGDTTTAMVGGLVGFYRGISVGHVEAGLRTGDLRRPFPEEMNRRVVDLVAAARFAPTAGSREHLLREGCEPGSVHVTGNTVVDALHAVLSMQDPSEEDDPVRDVLPGERLVVVTVLAEGGFQVGELAKLLYPRLVDRRPRLPDVRRSPPPRRDDRAPGRGAAHPLAPRSSYQDAAAEARPCTA
jgi:UDP-N-acetylglucosamine 2-epimerase (non-hydrolysing)